MHRIVSLVTCLIIAVAATSAWADTGDIPEISVKADMEIFYEMSDDVGGAGDDDRFKTYQLYLDFDGTFQDNMKAKVKLDGADMVGRHGKTVTEHFVEEANVTIKPAEDLPLTLVFGKDEMPFGLDYDKHLNDPISHNFEIDKVWGLHAICAIPKVGELAAAAYQHRHTLADGETTTTSDNEVGDNYTARLTVKPADGVMLNVSGASEAYADVSSTDDAGVASITDKKDETRFGAGVSVDCPKGTGNINAEYISFSNKGGMPGYDPSLITLGLEYNVTDELVAWGRYEIIGEDTTDPVETDFWTAGIAFSPVGTYTLSAEYSNFNSGDISDASDLMVARDSIEDSIRLGVRAQF